MKVKLDENLPVSLVPLLAEHGHDATTVADEGLRGADDAAVGAAAREEGRLLMTLDREFGDIRSNPPGEHPGIVLLRLDTPSRALVRAAVSGLMTRYRLDDLTGCVAVVQLGSVRIRRPDS